ncbi:MAG TPA: hypothetical protein VHL11_04090 [Phototrophicaceae bacterium]|nr:hypothetical protein [Phototrophicaceae bacterium]
MNSNNNEIADLRERVAKLERTVAFLLAHLQLKYAETPEEMFPEVAALVKQGNRMGAIKLYRDLTSASLIESQNFVDKIK